MYNKGPILVSHFFLPAAPYRVPPYEIEAYLTNLDHTKGYRTAKSSPKPSIIIFGKSKKLTFPINFFQGITKSMRGCVISPPPLATN